MSGPISRWVLGNNPSSGLRSAQSIATIPEAAWELFLGVYCTIWGFRRQATILRDVAPQQLAGDAPVAAGSPA